MKTKRKVELTIETEERFVIKKSGGFCIGRCSLCDGQMMTQEEAMTIAGISSRILHRWVEAGKVHSSETIEGFLLVCLNSFSFHQPGADDFIQTTKK